MTAAIQIVAGLVYAVGVTLTWGWLVEQQAPDRQMTWQWVVLFTAFFAWPIVIALGLVAQARLGRWPDAAATPPAKAWFCFSHEKKCRRGAAFGLEQIAGRCHRYSGIEAGGDRSEFSADR